MYDPSDVIDKKFLDSLPESATSALLKHATLNAEPPIERRIFVNRTLRMEGIEVVGFDLDWTLADYNRETMTRLTFDLTLSLLVSKKGYTERVLEAEFRPDFPRRGLLVDCKTGIIIKMNRHRHVGRAYLGRRMLDVEERRSIYRRAPINPSSKRYYHVDTLFELAEVAVLSEVVELHERDPASLPIESYEKLFADIRSCIDQVHSDGSLKGEIMSDLPKYLTKDPDMPLALRRLAMGGRKVVLITNSEWYFTNAICTYLLNDALPGFNHWSDFFDLVVVSSRKPAFFRDKNPFIELDDAGEALREVEVPDWGGVYQGGSRFGLSALFQCPGDSVLYVGDHIYGDVLSPKMQSMWRTALVVRELEEELQERARVGRLIARQQRLQFELTELGTHADDLRDIGDLLRNLAEKGEEVPEALGEAIAEKLNSLGTEHRLMRYRTAELGAKMSEDFNPYWGSLFKQGRNKSLFGNQVDDFACLYTSRASNFAAYGSRHYYRVVRDPMMHELDQDMD